MADLKAGFGRADITPPVGVDLSGYVARENPSAAVLDPLFARALALDANGSRALLMGIDCVGLEKSLGHGLRDRLARETGIPPEHILLLCSHTHSGPGTVRVLVCGEMNHGYLRGRFREGIISAARQAVENLAPCSARWGRMEKPEWHRYRRPQDRGPTDSALVDHVVRGLWIEQPTGEPMGCFWNYTAHPTILCTKEISGDWVGEAARRIEAATGGIAVYGQGCCGDVGPLQDEDPYASIRRMGEAVAESVLELRETAEDLALDSVSGRMRAVEIPFQRMPSRAWLGGYEVEMRTEVAALPPGVARRIALAMAEWAGHWANEEPPQTLEAELQILRLGPVIPVALPFEPLSGVGHAIRERLGPDTVVLGYTHAVHNYLAPASQYTVGGYEIYEAYRYYDLPAPWDESAAELVIDAVADLVEDATGEEEKSDVDSALRREDDERVEES